jgi:hypothetical protein
VTGHCTFLLGSRDSIDDYGQCDIPTSFDLLSENSQKPIQPRF